MLKFCIDKWWKNKDKLEEIIKNDKKINECSYDYLIQLVVTYILNDGDEIPDYFQFDKKNITIIDDGDYRGTLLFLIPRSTYQPGICDYLITYINYGSCSACDTLLRIQSYEYCNELPNEQQVKDYIILCKDLITNMKKPWNNSWWDEDFIEIEENENE